MGSGKRRWPGRGRGSDGFGIDSEARAGELGHARGLEVGGKPDEAENDHHEVALKDCVQTHDLSKNQAKIVPFDTIRGLASISAFACIDLVLGRDIWGPFDAFVMSSCQPFPIPTSDKRTDGARLT